MVYLVKDGRGPRAPGTPSTTWADRPYLYGRVHDATPDDIRVLSHHCVAVYDLVIGGESWWYGWCLDSHATELLAAGRVREVRVEQLLAIASGLVAGDDLVIR